MLNYDKLHEFGTHHTLYLANYLICRPTTSQVTNKMCYITLEDILTPINAENICFHRQYE